MDRRALLRSQFTGQPLTLSDEEAVEDWCRWQDVKKRLESDDWEEGLMFDDYQVEVGKLLIPGGGGGDDTETWCETIGLFIAKQSQEDRSRLARGVKNALLQCLSLRTIEDEEGAQHASILVTLAHHFKKFFPDKDFDRFVSNWPTLALDLQRYFCEVYKQANARAPPSQLQRGILNFHYLWSMLEVKVLRTSVQQFISLEMGAMEMEEFQDPAHHRVSCSIIIS